MGTKLASLVTKLTELRETIRKEGEGALKEAFSEFFTKHPAATAIVWTQYTPHFNDGDACTFDIHEFELHVDPSTLAPDVKKYFEKAREGIDDDVDDPFDIEYQYGSDVISILERLEDTKNNRDHNYSKYKLRALTPEEKSLVTDFNELEGTYRNLGDLSQEIIGDHVKVVVTKKGIKSQEHEHD